MVMYCFIGIKCYSNFCNFKDLPALNLSGSYLGKHYIEPTCRNKPWQPTICVAELPYKTSSKQNDCKIGNFVKFLLQNQIFIYLPKPWKVGKFFWVKSTKNFAPSFQIPPWNNVKNWNWNWTETFHNAFWTPTGAFSFIFCKWRKRS